MTNYELSEQDSEIVRCYECKHRASDACTMIHIDGYKDCYGNTGYRYIDQTRNDGLGFCDKGERE